jgi:uncharacterized protein (DUF433 family)
MVRPELKDQPMPAASLDHHIESTPGVCGGRPRIAGRRIRVQDIAFWHLKEGWSIDTLVKEFHVSPAEAHAALAYYFDHQSEIDDAVAADLNWEEEMKARNPSAISEEARRAYLQSLPADEPK